MERERWNVNGQTVSDYDGFLDPREVSDINTEEHSILMSSATVSPISSSAVSSSGANYIEHHVSKLDTLAGLAIKYGVEVADIKKMNGLVTDSQIYALGCIHIPRSARYPPSLGFSNDSHSTGPSSSNQSPTRNRNSDLLDPFLSLRTKPPPCKVSPAMSTLQGYYRLKSEEEKAAAECYQMAVYGTGEFPSMENGTSARPSSNTPPRLNHHRKSRSMVWHCGESGDSSDILPSADFRVSESDRRNDKRIRWRQKSAADFTTYQQEKLLKEQNSSGGGVSASTSKGLASKQKTSSRGVITSDLDNGNSPLPAGSTASSTGLWESLIDGLSVIRKSSSTSNLQDQDNSNSSFIWPTSGWTLKPDLQALSTAAITKPIFESLSKPKTGRRNKAALD